MRFTVIAVILILSSKAFGFAQAQNTIAITDLEITSRGWKASGQNDWRQRGNRNKKQQGLQAWMWDLLTTRFVQQGWTVVDRRNHDAATTREQDYGRSGRINPQSASRIGALESASKSAQISIMIETNRVNYSVAGIGASGTTARVRINGRITDVDTGIISTVAVTSSEEFKPTRITIPLGKKKKATFNLGGDRGGRSFFSSHRNSGNRTSDTTVNQAVGDAITKLARRLTANSPSEIGFTVPSLVRTPQRNIYIGLSGPARVGDMYGIWRNGLLVAELEIIELSQGDHALCQILRAAVSDLGQPGDTAGSLTPTIPAIRTVSSEGEKR